MWARGFLLLFMLVVGAVVGERFVPAADNDGDSQRIVAARSLPPVQRNDTLRQIAVEQASRNDSLAALQTLAQIQSPRELSVGLNQLKLQATGGSAQQTSKGGLEGEDGQGGRGGQSLADFTQLIDLIQTVVAPDTWEDTVGGPSTMFPYPGGILVDGSGLVKEVQTAPRGDMLANIEVMLHANNLSKSDADNWRLGSKFRCVSLRRLAKEVVKRRISGQPIDDCIRNLAGLNRIQYLLLDQRAQDVVLVGPVSGIETNQGWMRDRRTGQVTIRLEYFCAAVAATLQSQPFGCSIDPTPESLAKAAKVADQVRTGEVSVGLAADALRVAMGAQDVHVFGTAGDVPLAYMMVEADRHMKQLALGLKPLPEGVLNYLQIINKYIAQGPPDGQLLRLWFTSAPIAVRVDESADVYEIAGRPLKLARETSFAAQDGGRVPMAADFRLTEFVDSFNKHFDEVSALHPVYSALQSAYQAAAIAELLRRSAAAPWMPSILGPLLLDDSSLGQMQTPRAVDSIATLHRVTHRNQRHSIIVASGGVLIDTSASLEKTFRPYPSLATMHDRFPAQRNNNWWWNAE